MKHSMLAVFFAAATLIAQPAAQDKEAPPPLGAPRPFALPPNDTFTLKNGLKVTLAQHGEVSLVTVRAVVEFGHANEGAGQVWMSDLLTEMMREGTASLSSQQVANEAARMGGQLSVLAGDDRSSLQLDVLGEFAGDAVKLLADVLQHAALPPGELARVRGNLLRQLAVQLAEPQSQADKAYAAALYPDHPYGRLFPADDQLKGYQIDDVRKFYFANVGAQRTHLYIVGRFDTAVKKTIEEAFGNWSPGPAVQRNPPKPVAKKQLIVVDRPGAVQSTLIIGLPLSVTPADSDYIPLQVTNTLLGGAFSSRITNNIREQKGYTYSPYSFLSARYHNTSWRESADVTTKFTADSIKEILFEVNRLRKDPPAEQELKGIQNLSAGMFVLRNSSNSGIIGQLSFLELHSLSEEYLKTYIKKINAVTVSDVQRISETYLDPGKMTMVVVGDKSKIEESLKPYQTKP